MDDFGSEFDIKVDSFSLELCLTHELDNSSSVATHSFFLESKESNKKHRMRSFDEAGNKDDVEYYLYADQDNFFENFVSDGIFFRQAAVSNDFASNISIPALRCYILN